MSLLERVARGDLAGTVAELGELTTDQRRAELAGLTALRREQRGEWWRVPVAVRAALLIAGAGCHSAPSAAAAWIGGQDFRTSGSWDRPELWTVLRSRPVEWQIAVTTRLARRPARSWNWDEYPLLERLVLATGMPVPSSDAFVAEWLRHRSAPRFGAAHPTLRERLEHDPFVPVLVPRLFEVPGTGVLLAADRPQDADGWPACLARLADGGAVDRAALIDRCLARLLRGGPANDQRGFLRILQELAPTPAENAAHLRSHLALLDGLSTVAAHAQQVLTELDAAGAAGAGPPGTGPLDSDLLAEACAAVFFRTEKKLVRAQLSWLDRAARRDGSRAGAVLLALAPALGHPDPATQERALGLVARHLPAAGDAVLPVLRTAAEALDPAHHVRAADLLGIDLADAAEPYREYLPPAPGPRPLPGPLTGPAEVAEELAALLHGDPDVPAFERTLDGLVRHSHLDRPALAEALRPVLRPHPWAADRWADCTPRDLRYVAAAAAGELTPQQAWSARTPGRSPLRGNRTSPFGAQLAARLEEAAWQVCAAPPPFLLAVPTDAVGTLDPAVLIDRLAAYEAASATPGPVDLGQALLRVVPDPAAAPAAERLESPAGQRLARWLRAGGLPRQEAVPPAPDRARRRSRWPERLRRPAFTLPGARTDEPLPPDAARLVGPVDGRPDRTESFWLERSAAHWVAALPGHREELAARFQWAFAEVAAADRRGPAQILPLLAGSGGPAGRAVHAALAHGLGAPAGAARAAAVDALLVLAARGDLDGPLLGAGLADLVRGGVVKANRAAAALRSAADAGAHRTVWSVLAPALPGLLGDRPVHGAGELLALGADCARRCSARGPIAEVAQAGARGGAGRLVRQARALHEVLAAG
ncbi:DUF6493 family protein [Kitasatospora sp. NPDC088346]|uniref:DUF7824 domain-containing protein n=1 Tax=Kitasatospora sp. NPDC088346 TaxID=3364073 RepID=UPI00380D404F